MHQNDWFMRQLELGASAFLAKLLNQKSPAQEVFIPDRQTETDMLYSRLMELAADSKISEAEDLLFASIKTDDIDYLLTAFDFYFRLRECDDAYLEQCNFPRSEIDDGITKVKKLFGMDI